MADADAILDGEVTGYNVFSIAFDQNANVRQYRLMVTLNLLLRDRRKNECCSSRPGCASRPTSGPAPCRETISREETALKVAAVEIGRTIVSLAIARF